MSAGRVLVMCRQRACAAMLYLLLVDMRYMHLGSGGKGVIMTGALYIIVMLLFGSGEALLKTAPLSCDNKPS